jgi:hypothetical protein
LGFFKEESGVLYRQYNTKPEGLGDPNKGGINKGPEKIDLADLAVEGGLVRVDRVRIPYAYELSLGHYGLPHLDGAAPEVRRREVNGCPAVTAAIPGRRLALVAVYGWDGVDAVVHDGLHPEAATSTVPCAVCRRQKDYQGMAVLVTVLLHAADDGAWSDADLDVVRSVEVRPWSASGSPCGVGVALADGRRVEIDFGVIERGVVY